MPARDGIPPEREGRGEDMTRSERVADWLRFWVVHLLPSFAAAWLWDFAESIGWPLGKWAPHVFGRMMGATSWRREETPHGRG